MNQGEATLFSVNSIKAIADSIGFLDLDQQICKYLSEDVYYWLSVLIQEAVKFMRHAKRTYLKPVDFTKALKHRRFEPTYGFSSTDSVMLKHAHIANKDIFFNVENEVDLVKTALSPLAKLPLEPTIRAHWLVIDGKQPNVPENPSEKFKKRLKNDTTTTEGKSKKVALSGRYPKNKDGTVYNKFLKPYLKHDLSMEQQLYYKDITEACVGSDEGRRTQAINSLSFDPGLAQLLPRLSVYISEGVKVNLGRCNLAILIYLMRMIKALLDNKDVNLEKYLHELIPSVLSCLLSKRLCAHPETDNHWALRDFSASLIANICKSFFSSCNNNTYTRIVKVLNSTISINKPSANVMGVNASSFKSLSSMYGAFAALSELGAPVLQSVGFPKIPEIGERLIAFTDMALTSSSLSYTPLDKINAQKVCQLLLRICSQAILSLKLPIDAQYFKEMFGSFLAPLVHQTCIKLKSTPAPLPASISLQRQSNASSPISNYDHAKAKTTPYHHQAFSSSGGVARPKVYVITTAYTPPIIRNTSSTYSLSSYNPTSQNE